MTLWHYFWKLCTDTQTEVYFIHFKSGKRINVNSKLKFCCVYKVINVQNLSSTLKFQYKVHFWGVILGIIHPLSLKCASLNLFGTRLVLKRRRQLSLSTLYAYALFYYNPYLRRLSEKIRRRKKDTLSLSTQLTWPTFLYAK